MANLCRVFNPGEMKRASEVILVPSRPTSSVDTTLSMGSRAICRASHVPLASAKVVSKCVFSLFRLVLYFLVTCCLIYTLVSPDHI